MIQGTSLLAYLEILDSLGERQEQVYKVIAELGACCNTMIANKLHLPISSITPRVGELRKKNTVRLSHKGVCPFTGKTVMFWKVEHKLN